MFGGTVEIEPMVGDVVIERAGGAVDERAGAIGGGVIDVEGPGEAFGEYMSSSSYIPPEFGVPERLLEGVAESRLYCSFRSAGVT